MEAMRQDSGYGEADILLAVANGQVEMWSGQNSALLLRYQQHPAGKSVVIFAAGGDRGRSLKELLHMERIVTDIAHKNGCDKAEIVGRPGWERVMKNYRLSHVTLVRDLDDG